VPAIYMNLIPKFTTLCAEPEQYNGVVLDLIFHLYCSIAHNRNGSHDNKNQLANYQNLLY
jgi:hypothetical protein